MHFTPQDMAIIGAFLSLLGPRIFASSMLQPKRKMHIKVNKVGDDEEAFPENQGIMDVMKRRQKSTGSLVIGLDAQRFEESENEDEDEEGAADNDREATSSLGSSSVQSK
ncbi:unnamed protein product [Ectocarpus sp. 13 AM-2016]